MNRRNIYLISLILILIIASATIVYGLDTRKNENQGSSIGVIFKEYKLDNDPDKAIVADADGVIVTAGDLIYYGSYYSLANIDIDEREIINNLLMDRLFLKDAIDNGFDVTEEEVYEHITYLKQRVLEADQGKQDFYKFLREVEISEDEYWVIAYDTYKNQCILNKYKESLYELYKIENNIADASDESLNKFIKYLEDYKQDLLSNADVRYY